MVRASFLLSPLLQSSLLPHLPPHLTSLSPGFAIAMVLPTGACLRLFSSRPSSDPANDHPGIFVPTLAFFGPGPSQEVDLPTTAQHAVFLASSGVSGLTVHGTTGEPALLSRDERRAILTATREGLDKEGFENLPIVVGCGVSSTYDHLLPLHAVTVFS